MRSYLAIVAAFVGLSMIVGPFVGWSVRDAAAYSASYAAATGACTVLGLVVGVIWHRLRGDRTLPPREGYRIAWARLRAGMLAPARWRSYVVVALTVPLTIGWYSAWRVWLNGHVAFAWDATLASADAIVHGGRAPWRYVQWMTASPARLRLTEILYGVEWLGITHGAVTWMAFAPSSRARSRYLVTFALVFPLAGNVLAGLLMSAGPCYYARLVHGPTPYAGLVAALRSGGGLTGQSQALAWGWYAQGGGFPSTGVTATPSMHVVMATLTALALWAHGRRIAAGALVAFTIAASVALGWHYALDGYIAVLATSAVWWGAGWMTPRGEAPADVITTV